VPAAKTSPDAEINDLFLRVPEKAISLFPVPLFLKPPAEKISPELEINDELVIVPVTATLSLVLNPTP
jgi:hypothetical protein